MNIRPVNPKKAIRASVVFLMESGITSFPLNIDQVVKAFRYRVKVSSYNSFAHRFQCSSQFLLEQCGMDGEVAIVGKREAVEGISFDASPCFILYNSDLALPRGRRRFTIMHEYGHIMLCHNDERNSVFSSSDSRLCFLLEFSEDPLYTVWEEEANIFSRNSLCPAICAKTILSLCGYGDMRGYQENIKPDFHHAPLLHRFRGTPPAEYVLINFFDISISSAIKRLETLEEDLALSYKYMSEEQIHFLEEMTYRLICCDCGNVTLTPSLFCHNCGGQMFGYREDPLDPLPEPSLRESNQFAFCPGCGESDYAPDARFCPTCGHPLLNPCHGKNATPAARNSSPHPDFPHYCRSTEKYCGKCGATTQIAFDPPLLKRSWNRIPVPDMRILARSQVIYHKEILCHDQLLPASCPACGSQHLNRRLCRDCGELILNLCKDGHENSPNNRYCTICGKETRYLTQGWLSPYTDDPAFKALFTQEDQ